VAIARLLVDVAGQQDNILGPISSGRA